MNPDYKFPPKPKSEEYFTKPVSWLLGRDLIEGLKWIILFTVFKGKLDPRDWMSADVFPPENAPEDFWQTCNDENWNWKANHDTFWADRNKEQPTFWKEGAAEEFWFDFIADTGDGQISVYNVAYLCLSDVWTASDPRRGSSVSFNQTPEHPKLLPRGQFLFVGGDTTYHIADYTSLSTRFQQPFRWAFTTVRQWLQENGRLKFPPSTEATVADSEPRRPLFGIPGNHDYYDLIDGFNRQFRQPTSPEDVTTGKGPQLSIPGFRREQDASYIGLRLPFDWWFWGLDTEVSKLDVRQRSYFLSLMGAVPNKLILATPEPTTVFRERKQDDDKTLQAYEQLGLKQPYQAEDDNRPGICRLDLSGDVHHYARYYGPNTKNLPDPKRSSDHYASLVAGGGGAFLHPSETVTRKGESVEEQVLHPPAEISHAEVAGRLFDLRNIWHGGYVWLIGSVLAGVIYFASTVPRSTKEFLEWLWSGCGATKNWLVSTLCEWIPFTKDSTVPGLPEIHTDIVLKLSGFVWPTLLLVLALLVLGFAIYRFSKLIKLLAESSASDEEVYVRGKPWKASNEGSNAITAVASENSTTTTKNPADLPINYSDLKYVGLLVLVALVAYAGAMWVCVPKRAELHPFGSSLLVTAHIILTIELLWLGVQNSAWLAHRPKFETGTKHRYLPVWALTVLAALCVFSGIWWFGRYPAAYVLSDTIFALVGILVLAGLTFVGAKMGGELQKWPGKIFMGFIGFWHGLLQLVVPLVLIRIGDWRAVGWALLAIFVFSGLSIPFTAIRVPGLGVALMKLPARLSRFLLTLAWVLYGVLLLLLPLKFNQRGIFRDGLLEYSSFLEQSWVDRLQSIGLQFTSWLQKIDWLRSIGWLQGDLHAPVWIWLITSMAAVVLLGFILSMSLLSWYLAVSLAFQGHNNEVGGAARIEKFKHIVRIRLRRDDLTVYVIGIDHPKANANESEPNLIDVFTLRVT